MLMTPERVQHALPHLTHMVEHFRAASVNAADEMDAGNCANFAQVLDELRSALPDLLAAYEQVVAERDHERHEKETVAEASQASVAWLRAERDRLRAEVTRLNSCLATANAYHEFCEHQWYLEEDAREKAEAHAAALTQRWEWLKGEIKHRRDTEHDLARKAEQESILAEMYAKEAKGPAMTRRYTAEEILSKADALEVGGGFNTVAAILRQAAAGPPRCGTCRHWNNGDLSLECPIDIDAQWPKDGSGYCPKHQDAKP